MNKLYVGRQKQIELPKGIFLYIDDDVPRVPLAQTFDPHHYSIDALKRITKHQARELAELLYTIVPNGADTLTVRDGRRALAPALFDAERFDKISTKEKEAQAMIDDILFLPVLRNALCGEHPTFAIKRPTVILARLNRSEIGETENG